MFERIKQLSSMVFQPTGGQKWWFIPPNYRKFIRKVGDGSSSSVVTAPLLWIARNFPEAPPALWVKSSVSGEEERVTGKGEQGGDHIMLELMERPNQFYSGSMLWMATVTDWNLSGNGYWLKIRDQGKRPKEIWWIPSGLITPKGDDKNFITHYEYRPGLMAAGTIDVPPEDVVHFRYTLDPEDTRKGKSPLSALLQEVFTDSEAADFTATILGNMGVPGVVVAPKGDSAPGDDDVKATKAYFKEAFGGSRRGEPLVMSGATSVAQFGFSPQQLSLRDIRRIPEERVSAALGVPAIVAGLGAGLDRSTFANYSEAREAAYSDNIIPAQRMLSEDIKYQLLPDFQPTDFRTYRFGFDLSGVRVLQEDRNDLVERMNIGIQGGWVRVGEGRRVMDLEVEDTDDVYLRGMNIIEVPAGEAAALPMLPLVSPGQPGTQPASSNGNGNEPAQLPPGQSIRKRRRPSRMQATLVAMLARDGYILSAHFAKELEDTFIGFGDACAEAFQQMTSKQSTSNGRSTKQVDAEKLARVIAAMMHVSFDDILRAKFEKHTRQAMTQTFETIAHAMNLSGGVADEVQKDLFNLGASRRGLLDIQSSTQSSLLSAINQGNQQGLNPVDIGHTAYELIKELVPAGPFPNAGPAYRAQLISRTETAWVQNKSSLAFYRASDEVGSVMAMDGSGDPECAERNGQEYSFDDADVEMSNEHPNGTLAFAPILADGGTVPRMPEEALYFEPMELNSLAWPTGKEGADLENINRAVSNIENQHMFPGNSTPVKIHSAIMNSVTTHGSYQPFNKEIKIAKMPAITTRSSTYHELGHYLDNMLYDANSTEYWSQHPTQRMSAIMSLLEKRFRPPIGSDAKYVEYLKRPQEMFARAYAQYIALKTDPEVYKLLALSNSQWSPLAFKSIAIQFDKMIQENGLTRAAEFAT